MSNTRAPTGERLYPRSDYLTFLFSLWNGGLIAASLNECAQNLDSTLMARAAREDVLAALRSEIWVNEQSRVGATSRSKMAKV